MSFHEKSFTMNPKNLKNNLEFIYDGFPFSFVIVEYFFKNISLFLNEFPSVFYYKLLKDSLFCLFTNECKPGENERNYQDLKKNSSSLIENIDFYARNFLTFSKLFLEKYLKFESDKLHELFNLFESKYMQKFLDVSKLMDNSFILIIPIKVKSKNFNIFYKICV